MEATKHQERWMHQLHSKKNMDAIFYVCKTLEKMIFSTAPPNSTVVLLRYFCSGMALRFWSGSRTGWDQKYGPCGGCVEPDKVNPIPPRSSLFYGSMHRKTTAIHGKNSWFPMDFRCWKGRAHQRGAAVGPQPWRHPNVRPTVTLGCETSCPGFSFSPMAVPTFGHLISIDIISRSSKRNKTVLNMDISSAFLWEMLRTVPSLLPQTCFKDVKQPVERLGKGVNNFKTYRRAQVFPNHYLLNSSLHLQVRGWEKRKEEVDIRQKLRNIPKRPKPAILLPGLPMINHFLQGTNKSVLRSEDVPYISSIFVYDWT